MRKDPPFDMEYVTSTWLLERAEAEGARIFNSPRALRDHSEKLADRRVPQFTVPSLVARDARCIKEFIGTHRDTVLKPLDGMGGSQVFRVRADDPNRNVIIETLTHNGQRTIMAQRFIPEIIRGRQAHPDRRRRGGAVLPGAHPMAGETRGNLAVGGRGEARPLDRARPGDRRNPGAGSRPARHALRRHRRDRRLADRDQRHQPDLHGRDLPADRFRCRRHVHQGRRNCLRRSAQSSYRLQP
jgi:hypothetical protein